MGTREASRRSSMDLTRVKRGKMVPTGRGGKDREGVKLRTGGFNLRTVVSSEADTPWTRNA